MTNTNRDEETDRCIDYLLGVVLRHGTRRPAPPATLRGWRVSATCCGDNVVTVTARRMGTEEHRETAFNASPLTRVDVFVHRATAALALLHIGE
jgi:hypothetical protein